MKKHLDSIVSMRLQLALLLSVMTCFCSTQLCCGEREAPSPPDVVESEKTEMPGYKTFDVPEFIFDLIEAKESEDNGTWKETELCLSDCNFEVPEVVVHVIDTWETQLEVDITQQNDACVPVCEFADGTPKQCGPDGCGSICGYCGYGEMCVEGLCMEYCSPQCEGKECGPDGCYGECPPGCDEGFVCGDDGHCYPFCDHEANCQGKECGDDGCGGTCGTCGLGFVCNQETGLCEPDPCGDVPEGIGKCKEGNVLVQCIGGELVETPCSDFGPDYYCKWDGVQQKYVCAQGCEPKCTFPDGTPKQCGSDGCWGVCGTCPAGWECTAGLCYPVEGGECAWVTEAGECYDNVLWFCSQGKLYYDDCSQYNKQCKFDVESMKFLCL